MSQSLRMQLVQVRDALFPRADNALGCGKKQRYVSKAAAICTARNRMRDSANPPPCPLYAYSCSQCGGWHLTKLEQPRAEP
jgi:hypothetical protein